MLRLFAITISSLILHFTTSAQQLPLQWGRVFQGQGKASDRVAAITTDPSGNIYVAGHAGNHHGAPDAFAMKRNLQGDTLWTYYYDAGGNNEDYATAIEVDNAGNTYITGNSHNAASFIRECFVAKILPSGAEDWSVRYTPGGNMESFGKALTVDASGNVYVCGYSDPLSGSSDWLVIKYNSSGAEQWVDVLNGPGSGDDEAFGLAIGPNGNITVCGFVYDVNASGYINAFVKQYTPAGGTAWSDTWTNAAFTGADKAFEVGYSTAGDIFIGGETINSSGSNRDAFAMRYDQAGNQQWVHIYTDINTTSDEHLTRVAVDDSGNVYFTGTDFQDGYVTRINSNGTNGFRKEWRGPLSNGFEVFHGVTPDNLGNVYVTGRGVYPGEDYYGNGGLPNMIIAKYNAAGDSLWTYRCIDSLNSSMGFAIDYRDGKLYAGGFVTDTAYVDENLYILIVDTAGNAVTEWSYNGRGDAITLGQFVVTDATDHVYCAATLDRLYGQGTDVVLVKYDPAGNLLWVKYYSSYGWCNDTLTALQLDPSGNLILCISTDSALTKTKYRLSLLKADADGNFTDTAWYNSQPTESILAKSMAVRNDGSIAIAANSNFTYGTIVWFDPSFNQAWSVKIDTTQLVFTRANSVDFFPNGDLAAGGYSQAATVISGIVNRYDANGTQLWSAEIDSAGVNDEVRDVSVSTSGDVAFTGSSGANTTYTAIVGKVDAAGSLLWRRVYNPTTVNEHGVKVRFTPAGDIVFISRGWTGFVVRYATIQHSGTGTFQWATVYQPTASDREPVDLIVEPGNRVVTAGWEINGFSSNYDYVLAGYTSSGAVDFVNTYSDSLPVSSSWDQLRDLARDNQGNFIVTGYTATEFFNNYLFKMLTIKYGGVVIGTEEITAASATPTYIYPNPSQDGIFSLRGESPDQLKKGIVYDVHGRQAGIMDIQSGQVDLSGCIPGIYVLLLERKNAPAEYFKLILSR